MNSSSKNYTIRSFINRKIASFAYFRAAIFLLLIGSEISASPLDIEGRGYSPGQNVIFYSFDQAGEERYGTWGVKSSPTEHLGLSGPRIFTSFGSKLGEYDPLTRQSHNRLDYIRTLMGYEWLVPDTAVSVLFGSSTMLYAPQTQLLTLKRGRLGFVAMGELWRNAPRNAAFGLSALSATIIIDTGNQSLYARLRPYFHMPIPALAKTGIKLGPEISFTVSNSLIEQGIFWPEQVVQTGWTKLRMGGHISEIPLLKARMSLSTGLEIPDDGKKRFYGNITTYVRF